MAIISYLILLNNWKKIEIEGKKYFDDDCYETEYLKEVAFAAAGGVIEAVN